MDSLLLVYLELIHCSSVHFGLTEFFFPPLTHSQLSSISWPSRSPRLSLLVLGSLGWQTFQCGGLSCPGIARGRLGGLAPPKAKGVGVADDLYFTFHQEWWERSLEDPGCGEGGGCHLNPHGRSMTVMTTCMLFVGYHPLVWFGLRDSFFLQDSSHFL